MLCDFHIHTSFSADSRSLPETQADAAADLGMKEICITDHHDPGSESMSRLHYILDIPSYLSGIRKLSEKYQGIIQIRTGIELGLMLREQETLTELVRSLPVDFILGSSHFTDGYDIYDRAYYEGKTEKEAYSRYFESTLERIRVLDCFDSLAHLDCILRYGPNKNKNYRPADYMDIIDEILKLLIARGKALECNTAGYKYGLGHLHPHEEILRRYRELGGELLTVGSDGHRPEEIGKEFIRAESILKACGFRYYTVYRNRRPVFLKLDD